MPVSGREFLPNMKFAYWLPRYSFRYKAGDCYGFHTPLNSCQLENKFRNLMYEDMSNTNKHR